LGNLLKEADFELEILYIEIWVIRVVPQGLEHEFSPREEVSFQIKFCIDANEPEI
jgi:hypothetical protein